MTSPLLLALDTSTSTASLALFDGERVLSETTWIAGREHSTRLLLEVEIAFERSGHRVEDLTGLVVARGPGSFTGVRVALSVGKGLAAALKLPAWGVNTLDVVALAAPTDLPVMAVVEAGRGRYAIGLYTREKAVAAPALANIDQLIEMMSRPTVVIGELRAADRERLERVELARVAAIASSARRAGFLAELGWRLAKTGDPGDPAALDALYVS